MNHDGKHFEANFGRASLSKTKTLMESALRKWRRASRERGDKVQAVPRDKLDLTLGKDIEKGGAKLQVTIRDLPRNDGKEIGGERWYPRAVNFNWIDMTQAQMSEFITTSRRPREVSPATFETLFLKTLKDNARGQMKDWEKEDLKSGKLTTQLVRREGNFRHFAINGQASFQSSNASYDGQLLGRAIYNTRQKQFTSFELCASGRRSGRSGASGRHAEPDGTPLGHLYRMVNP